MSWENNNSILNPFSITYENDFLVVNTGLLYDFLSYVQFVGGCVEKNSEWKAWYRIGISVPKRSEPKTDDDQITLSLLSGDLDPSYRKQLKREDNPAKSLHEEVSAYLEHFATVGIISGKVSFSTEYEYLDHGDDTESVTTPEFYVWDIPYFDAPRLSGLVETGYMIYSARTNEDINEIIEKMMEEDQETVVPVQDIDEYLTMETEEPSIATISTNTSYYHPKELLRGENEKSMILSVRTVEQILVLMKHHGVYDKLSENSADMIGRIIDMGEIWAVRDRFTFYSVEYFLYSIWYLNEAFYWNRLVRACETLFGAWSHFVYDLRGLLSSDGLSSSVLSKAPNPVSPTWTEGLDGGSDVDLVNENGKTNFGDIFFSKKGLQVGLMEIRDKKDKKYYEISFVGRFSEADLDAEIDAEFDEHYKKLKQEEKRKLMAERIKVVSKEAFLIPEEVHACTQAVYKWLYAIVAYGKNIPGSSESVKRKEYFGEDGTKTFERDTEDLGTKFPKLANNNGLSAIPKTKSQIKSFLGCAKSKCIIVEKITNMALEYDPNRIIKSGN